MAIRIKQSVHPHTLCDGVWNAPPVFTTVNLPREYRWMDSQSNPGYKTLGKGNSDVGSAWKAYQYEAEFYPFVGKPYWVNNFTSNKWRNFMFLPSGSNTRGRSSDLTINNTFASMAAECRALGPTAIARTNPSVPYVDLGTAIGELITGGLPSLAGRTLWKERANPARGAGSEYLNYQFGWVPLVNDIRDVAYVVDNMDRLYSEYERGSGKDQHRRYAFPSVETFSQTTNNTTTGGQVYPQDTVSVAGGAGTSSQTISTTTTKKTWFSGCFRYYLPEAGFARDAALARKFLGADITPSTLWNLAPWSWAADWQGNVGDVMTNLSYLGLDASVMRYGYMMQERIVKTEVSTVFQLGDDWKGSSDPFRAKKRTTAVYTESYKIRVKASPYSFSASPTPLTAKQTAIVAALGLSRT